MPPCTIPNNAFFDGPAPRSNSAAAPLRPAQRQPHRFGCLLQRGRRPVDLVRRALVEHHRDIGVEYALDAHRFLRREKKPIAVDRRGEAHAFFTDLPELAQREHLEAPGVGEDRALPAHEAMQAVVRGDHVESRSQPQMKRVAEHDLRVHFHQFVRCHRLDGAIGADRHEHRGLDGAVRERDAGAPGRAIGREDFERQAHGARATSIASP
jgi:hypothetical protein